MVNREFNGSMVSLIVSWLINGFMVSLMVYCLI